ncbi:MAG: protein kinase domain-containing protein [Candidatus Eiseniibacteriota bacterium]
MADEHWDRVRALFEQVLELRESERTAFLDRELAGEPAVRADLVSLLSAGQASTEFLAGDSTGDHGSIGPYRLVKVIGEGGFGVVYLAEQERPLRRRVALKLIKRGMDTKQVIARFEAERQALAMMDHPGIAQVFDAGETEMGRPYFVMEYVPGVPITRFCDEQRLTLRDRLSLLANVCDAVQHAHQKGVIHRDIKPTNVVVARRDGVVTPKVIDFGIAKATTGFRGGTLMTQEGAIVGTLGYMSPEQAGALDAPVDTRSDIYSLGVMLYELLIGALPFDDGRLRQGALSDALRVIREEDPPALTVRLARSGGDVAKVAERRSTDARRLLRDLKGELQWITLRALEKDPERRYSSAAEFAADIRRHLTDEPVLAGAPTATYRIRKFVRRHRGGVAAATLVLAAILAGGIASTVSLTRAVRAERETRLEAESARQVADFLVGLFSASTPDRARGAVITAQTLLEEGTRRIRDTVTEDPRVRARLLTTLGHANVNLAQYDQGIALLREALAVTDSSASSEPVEVVTQLYALATGLLTSGRGADDETGATLDRALAILRDSGADRPDLLSACLRGKGSWFNERGELAPAESLLTLAIRTAESVSPPDTAKLVRMYSTRANIAHRQFHLEDAERHYLHALELAEKSGQPSWSISMHRRLASVYGALGDPEKAIRHAEEGVRLARQIYSPDHPNLADALSGLASALASKGDDSQAITVSEEVVRITRQSGRSFDLALELNSLGLLYRSSDQPERAVACAEESWRIRNETLGAGNARTAESLANLARSLFAAGQTARADSSFQAAIAVFDRLDATGVFTAVAYASFANLCRDTKRLARADTLYAHAQALLDSTNAGLRPYAGECLMDHGYLRSLQGRHAEAEAMIAAGFPLRRGETAETDPGLGQWYLIWAASRAAAGDVDGALGKLREAARCGVTSEDAETLSELAALRSRADYPLEDSR